MALNKVPGSFFIAKLNECMLTSTVVSIHTIIIQCYMVLRGK